MADKTYPDADGSTMDAVWQPIETLPDNRWVIGKLEGEGRAPAFVGKKYELAERAWGRAALIDEWSGKWKEVSAWMPLPAGPEEV